MLSFTQQMYLFFLISFAFLNNTVYIYIVIWNNKGLNCIYLSLLSFQSNFIRTIVDSNKTVHNTTISFEFDQRVNYSTLSLKKENIIDQFSSFALRQQHRQKSLLIEACLESTHRKWEEWFEIQRPLELGMTSR